MAVNPYKKGDIILYAGCKYTVEKYIPQGFSYPAVRVVDQFNQGYTLYASDVQLYRKQQTRIIPWL